MSMWRFDKRKCILISLDALIIFSVIMGLQFLIAWTTPSSLIFKDDVFSAASWISTAVAIVLMVIVRAVWGVYHSVWRYARVASYLRLVAADVISCGLLLVLFALLDFGFGFASTTMVVLLSCLLALVERFLYQVIYASRKTHEDSAANDSHRINIAVVGAGNIGASLVEELQRNPQAHYRPLFFVDIDKDKVGRRINGLPIYLEDDNVVDRIRKSPVQEVVIALPDLDSFERKKIYNKYKETGCKIKIFDYPVGDTYGDSKRRLREFNIEDVLFRDPIKLDNLTALEFYRGKTVLVTGGGGSIGSELCRQIAAMQPKRLIIFDIYENNAYDIQQELVRRYGAALTLDVLIGSVRDVERLEQVFATYKPDVVLHAAAHKHVPLMEKSPAEVIKNNVLGTYNTANMAEKYGVERFVLISTDKAVNPTNVMGASKRLCEMIVGCRRDSKTRFVAVRFGNVLGSNGSVIPLFRRQIAEGGPVTITDKRIIRYFMTIPEAAQLVLEAGSLAKRGELFVLDMGKPIHIYDLARNMIQMSGLVPDVDIEIREVGLRPGEKLYEELLVQVDHLETTENSLIFVEREEPLQREEVEAKLALLKAALKDPTPATIKEAMHQTVPTFHTPEEVNCTADQSREMQEANT
ncbi:MAG: polysaccharide biosynthesis protein [Clostridia bacterium]|nr:polysaccharide biosynthesis protein [Clostridia bacterium]